ncbi:GAF and ANTAR domain-containing protein [Pseudarthrobacter sp. CCNWLW207]|uniref:GAF and ANTAR domain-containing protein n=1 Tax=Pseudarthrobacter sp. CCNWLW207 TaxID=3127468 RepID=UPI0030772611
MDHNQLGATKGEGRTAGHVAAAEDEHRLLGLVLDSPEITSFLTELAIMTASCLSTQDNIIDCGVTVLREKKPAVAASSDARAASLDELQNGFGEGPCLTALHGNTTILIPDLLVEERWHRYTEAALDNGVRSVLAVPLNLAGEAHGVTNLYSRQPNGFSDLDVLTAENFVANASRSIQLALSMAHLKGVHEDLLAAMQSRTIIDMAVGVVMAQNGSSQDEAISILTRASNSRNVKLREVASTVVDSVGGKGTASKAS